MHHRIGGTLAVRPKERGQGALDQRPAPLNIAGLVDRLNLDNWDAADLQRWTAMIERSLANWRDARQNFGRR